MLFISSLNALSYEKSQNIVIDTQHKLMWQDNKAAKEYLETFQSAKVYCEQIILNGYIDWRVPTIDEMIKIIDVKNTDPIAKEFQNVQRKTYITNSTFVEDSLLTWGVDFSTGKILTVNKEDMNHIRCVREIK